MTDAIKDLVKIKVIGVGGGGGNAINDMLYSGVTGVEYIAANTDKQDLEKSLADVKLQIGEKLTKGQGAGASPEVGRQAAEEDIEKIQELLRQNVDSLVIIPNDKLFDLPDKSITLQNAFKEANNILRIGIKAVVDLVLGQGFINLDFADIKSVLKDSDIAVLGFGDGEGENRAMKAAEKALQSPLLEKSIQGADKILINLMTSQDVGLSESQTVTDVIRQAAGKKIEDVMFGVTIVPEFTDRIEITIIANNFKEGVESNSDSPIKMGTGKVAESSKQTESKEDPDDVFDIPPWMRNNKR